jgi:hypothetical protein
MIWCESLQVYVVASEAKGWQASVYDAHAQAFQASGDGALLLHDGGLETDDCVVFGLVVAGGAVQIVATHLLPSNFPSFGVLSPPLSYIDPADRPTLVRYLCALGDAARASLVRAKEHLAPRQGGRKGQYVLTPSKLFLKPVPVPNTAVSNMDVPSGSLQGVVFSARCMSLNRMCRWSAITDVLFSVCV